MTPPRLPNDAERIVLAAEAASPTVRLVGGAGLGLLLSHRVSDDVDLFGAVREDIEPIIRTIEHEALALGRTATRVRSGPGFARIEIPEGASVLRVDVAADSASRLVIEDTFVGSVRVESLRDQRANKIIALLGRSELRDLVDLFFIQHAGLPVVDGFNDALTKDAGMDPAWFAWAVEQIEPAPLRGLIVPLALDQLRSFQKDLVRDSLDRSGATR